MIRLMRRHKANERGSIFSVWYERRFKQKIVAWLLGDAAVNLAISAPMLKRLLAKAPEEWTGQTRSAIKDLLADLAANLP